MEFVGLSMKVRHLFKNLGNRFCKMELRLTLELCEARQTFWNKVAIGGLSGEGYSKSLRISASHDCYIICLSILLVWNLLAGNL